MQILRCVTMTLAAMVLTAGALWAGDLQYTSYYEAGQGCEASEATCDSGCESCDPCRSCGLIGRLDPWGLRCNTALFLAGDGWKTKADDDDNNNFGFRGGFNTGVGLGRLPVRGQIGFSLGVYDFYGREDAEERSAETQVFLTLGAYKRSDVCRGDRLCYGLVWDYMNGHNFGEEASETALHQVRGRIGYAVSARNEFGTWMAFRLDSGRISVRGVPTRVDPMNQINFYWLRNWPTGADTMAYVGWADEPAEMVIGLRGHSPLSCRTALFGGVHFGIPSTSAGDLDPNGVENSYSEETWNVSLGVVVYPGAQAISRTVSGHAGLPLLPVADNGTFAVSAPTGNL